MQRPRVSFPQSQPPTSQSRAYDSYQLENSSAHLYPPSDRYAVTPEIPRARAHSIASPSYLPVQPTMAFPEPQVYRATSAYASLHPSPPLIHRNSRSDFGASPQPALQMQRGMSSLSINSVTSSYYNTDEDDQWPAETPTENDYSTREITDEVLTSEEGVILFQGGKLLEKDEDWYRLVPTTARDALGKMEVQRQSVLFEVLKSERDYVFDLQAVKEVFIEPLKNADPPILAPNITAAYIEDVFGNALDKVLQHHEMMMAALFSRQREQHPLINSIADIILDTTLKADFRKAYEVYIKHYPLSESRHRSEMRRNEKYSAFINSVSNDPRIRKRDLVTFLSRPVTRLPRLNLLLEQVLKLTDKEHPDVETLPIILGILKDCIKSTQPGIESAENKVKLWEICQSLMFQRGEILDMDLYSNSRSLVYSGPVVRKKGSETTWSSWSDHFAVLMDHYFLLTRDEKRSNTDGTISNSPPKRFVASRPLPLSYLRLGSFDSPVETRRERGDDGVLSSLRYRSVSLYPFTIYHAASIHKRYTLYAASEAQRQRWHNFFVDALAVHKARQEGNMYFVPEPVSSRYFHASSLGKVTCAVPFVSGGRKYLAVGCQAGIYVSPKGQENFRKVLAHENPTAMAAIQIYGNKIFNKFIIHHGGNLLSYSLDLLARVSIGEANAKTLTASLEKIGGNETVVFFRHAHISSRALLIIATKKLLGASLNLNVLEAIDVSETSIAPKRKGQKLLSFRQFGETGFVPKDARDVSTLAKSIGICASEGIVILDPTNVATSSTIFVPDLRNASSSPPMASLKTRLETARPLGLVRCSAEELLVIYDVLGCYITKHGEPSRKCGFITWESPAVSFAARASYVLLFSSKFIEVHDSISGKLLQVYEASEICLLYKGPSTLNADDPIIIAVRGDRNSKDGTTEKIMELLQTSEITSQLASPPVSAFSSAWDEWDM